MHFGGHQERERRAGTENVAGDCGVRRGCGTGPLSGVKQAHCATSLSGRRWRASRARWVNAGRRPRLPNTSNLCFPGVSGEALVIALDLGGFAVSSGAACASGSIEPSHVLLAMGLRDADARVVGAILAWGWETRSSRWTDCWMRSMRP